MIPTLYLLAEVAERLRVSPRKLKDVLKEHPTGRRAGRTRLFFEEDIQALYNVLHGSNFAPDVQRIYIERPWRHNKPLLAAPGQRVYVIRSGQYVKIGCATDVGRRFAVLQIAHPEPLELIFTTPGGGPEEAELHRRFAEHRVRGEWFRFADEIRRWIAEEAA